MQVVNILEEHIALIFVVANGRIIVGFYFFSAGVE
jgi:hypothetical protein